MSSSEQRLEQLGQMAFMKSVCGYGGMPIYRVTGSQVIIYLIADGRRDMQSVLARRLLSA